MRSDRPLDRAERLYDRTAAAGGRFADNTMKYRRFMSAITRDYQPIGFVTAARRCLAIAVACLALFAGPRAELAANPVPAYSRQERLRPRERHPNVLRGLWSRLAGPAAAWRPRQLELLG